jgi:hypothetical protein
MTSIISEASSSLTSYEDGLTSVGVHGTTSDQAPLDQLVGVTAHDLTILAGTRLTLIGVDNQVTGTRLIKTETQ